MRTIEHYSKYIQLRISQSTISGVLMTPSVAHTYDKPRKADTTLALNGIATTRELRRLKEKS